MIPTGSMRALSRNKHPKGKRQEREFRPPIVRSCPLKYSHFQPPSPQQLLSSTPPIFPELQSTLLHRTSLYFFNQNYIKNNIGSQVERSN